MKFGIYIANYGITKHPQDYIEMAKIAEENNWDGFFLWDHLNPQPDKETYVHDSFTLLSALAVITETIRIGTTVSPLARYKPRILARQIATIDQISGGRMILGVGLGEPPEEEFGYFGEDPSAMIRGEKLDESLTILRGLWSGEPFEFIGEHFKVKSSIFVPTPIQNPLPIWIGGGWPNKKPFRRAALYEGVFPLKEGFEERLTPEDYLDILEYIKKHEKVKKEEFDVIIPGYSFNDKHKNTWIKNYQEIGVNWFLECFDPWRGELTEFMDIIARGPPVI